nr:alpha-ribazole phosphatase [Tenacibaculum mesophilum]
MEVILVRHTTPDISKGICYGQADIKVATTFEEEVSSILKKVPVNDADVTYYSSPLKRCKLLAKKLSANVIFDNRLKELDFGDWELQKWNDIDKKELDIWMNDFVKTPAKNGESYIDLHKRTTNFLTELTTKNHQKVVLVTHAGVMRSLWAYMNEIPLEKSFELKLNYGDTLTFHL